MHAESSRLPSHIIQRDIYGLYGTGGLRDRPPHLTGLDCGESRGPDANSVRLVRSPRRDLARGPERFGAVGVFARGIWASLTGATPSQSVLIFTEIVLQFVSVDDEGFCSWSFLQYVVAWRDDAFNLVWPDIVARPFRRTSSSPPRVVIPYQFTLREPSDVNFGITSIFSTLRSICDMFTDQFVRSLDSKTNIFDVRVDIAAWNLIAV